MNKFIFWTYAIASIAIIGFAIFFPLNRTDVQELGFVGVLFLISIVAVGACELSEIEEKLPQGYAGWGNISLFLTYLATLVIAFRIWYETGSNLLPLILSVIGSVLYIGIMLIRNYSISTQIKAK